MSNVVHFSLKKLKDCSRTQSQIKIDKGSIHTLRGYFDVNGAKQKILKNLENADESLVCIFHQQRTLLVLLICYFIFRNKNIRFIYDMHDLNQSYQHQEFGQKIKGILLYWLSFIFEFMVARLDISVLTVSKGLARIFYMRYRKSCTVFYNLPDVEELVQQHCVQLLNNPTDSLCYFGVLKEARITPEMFRYFRSLDIQLDIYGRIEPSYEYKLAMQGIFPAPKVSYKGEYNGQDIISTLRNSGYKFSLCVFDVNTTNLRFCMPNKVFQSLVAGVPVLCTPALKEMLITFKSLGMVKAINTENRQMPKVGVNLSNLKLFLSKMFERNSQRYLAALNQS